MPVSARNSTRFSRINFDEWLTQRRLDEGLAPAVPRDGEPVFKSWLRDHWKAIQELPEARGLSLFCERDVTFVVCEHAEHVAIDDQLHALTIFEVLPFNRPRDPFALSSRLRQLSADVNRRVLALKLEILDQIPKIEQAISENKDRLSASDIESELDS